MNFFSSLLLDGDFIANLAITYNITYYIKLFILINNYLDQNVSRSINGQTVESSRCSDEGFKKV